MTKINQKRNDFHPTSAPLIKVVETKTTPLSDTDTKQLNIDRKAVRLAQNEEYLKNKNVKAFLDMLAEAEGGDYNLKYGGFKGKSNDKWRISDYSTHPGAGADGKTTAAGRYQINKMNWEENGIKKMGLSDFSPHTQDLIAVEGLRQSKAIDFIVNGDIQQSIAKAFKIWNSLAEGPGLKNRVHGQHFVEYEKLVEMFKKYGGTVNDSTK